MKKLLLFVLTSLFIGGALFAQTDESGKVKNEGNAAWRAKNYKEAFTKWEQYLKLIEFKDDSTVYNVAVCATKLKDYANTLVCLSRIITKLPLLIWEWLMLKRI